MCVLKYTPLIFGILGSAMFQPGMMQAMAYSFGGVLPK
jgi:hypothetical protein